MSENPFDPPVAETQLAPDTAPTLSAYDAYNVVSDTVTGVNLRWSDNKFQAKFVFVSVIVPAILVGGVAAINSGKELHWGLAALIGAIVGAFIGLIFGILASGTILMVYRANRHLKGKHD